MSSRDEFEPEPALGTAAQFAVQIRRSYLHRPFGIIKFWGTAMVPPNDQSYELVSTHADGDRLDLVFVHESRSGRAGVISIWQPEGLESAPAGVGQGMAIRTAQRLQLDDSEAFREGTQYRCRTSRGEGVWPITGEPALVLAR